MLVELLLIAAAFLVGSVPTGFIVGRLKGVDVRVHGSGNTGATNVSRVLGKKLGILVLLLDASKGVLAVMLATHWPIGAWDFKTKEEVEGLLGLFGLLGHCFSPFLRFRGGKGVATGLGVYLSIAPVQAIFALGVFLALFKMYRYVSLGSVIAAFSIPIFMAVDQAIPFSQTSLGFALATSIVIAVRHRGNIARLLKGEEPKYKSGSAV